MWQFFNPVHRNWEFLRILKQSTEPASYIVILRNNWVIGKVLKGRPAFYYEVMDNRIKNIRPEVAYTLAYKYATGIRELEVSVSLESIKIDLNAIHLPNAEYKKLIELGELIQMPENNYLLIPTSEVRDVYELLEPLGIIVKAQGTKPLPASSSKRDLKSKLSDVLTLLYSKYLKKN